MPQTQRDRRLAFVKAEDLELWRCRPLGTVDVLDLKDRRVGRFEGLVLDSLADRPLYIVVGSDSPKGSKAFLVPLGDAWFDDTERAIRIDVKPGSGEAPPFDAHAFERMTADEAAEFERRVLGECCPEVGLHRDGTPDYERSARFQCPSWLREPKP